VALALLSALQPAGNARAIPFLAKTDFATGAAPWSVATGDLSGDGKPDLAVANGGGGVSILLGDGAGSFGTRTDFPTGTLPASVAIGDLNRDGKRDLAVANNGASTVSVLLGDGAGSFGAAAGFATGVNPYSVAIGDVNGDGKPDLAVANNGAGTVSILLGDGAGSFGAKADSRPAPFPSPWPSATSTLMASPTSRSPTTTPIPCRSLLATAREASGRRPTSRPAAIRSA
jgi:hypothetical protein